MKSTNQITIAKKTLRVAEAILEAKDVYFHASLERNRDHERELNKLEAIIELARKDLAKAYWTARKNRPVNSIQSICQTLATITIINILN